MPGSGYGRRVGIGTELDIEDLSGQPLALDQAGAAAAVADDLFFGVAPPGPTVIPYAWLSPPATFRADQPINNPQVNQSGSGTAQWPNETSIATYGEFASSFNIATISDGDGPALAYYVTTYYSGFRMRSPAIVINLLDPRRTQDQVWRVLGVRIGDRILVPDAPATWPEGANTAFVEGITHTVAQNQRLVTWNCSPVIGASPGVVGPWFTLGVSFFNSTTDKVPF